MNSVSLNGLNIYPFLNKHQILEFIRNRKCILIAVNAEKIINQNDKLKKIICKNIGYADGIGAVWALRKKGFKAVKIPGVELWLDIIKANYTEKSFYFIGASEEVINETIIKIEKEFVGISILGFHNGFLDERLKMKIIEDIVLKKPDIVFVAMGTPKQEFFMNELFKFHPALYMGLGGSFDVYAGKIKRAPFPFRKLNLEWLYRLLQEPSRIFRQKVLIKFLVMLFLKKIK